MPFKNSLIKLIKRTLFNYEHPRYHRFLYHLSRQYVDFYRGEHNADMKTNGEYRFLDKLSKIHPIRVCIDIGANFGDYGERIAQLNNGAEIHCFEPGSDAFSILKNRLGSDKKHFLNNYALSDTAGEKEMYINKDASQLNSFHQVTGDVMSMVKIDTLDNYVKERGISHMDLVKMDTEGHEFFVLRGGDEFFRKKCADFVQFEFGNAAIYARTFFRDIFDFFNDREYDIYKIKPLTLEKVVYAPEYEKIMYANFVAVRKDISVDSLL